MEAQQAGARGPADWPPERHPGRPAPPIRASGPIAEPNRSIDKGEIVDDTLNVDLHVHDEHQLAEMGYRQQLSRVVGIWQNFTVGFTYLSPVVGVYPLLAYAIATSGGVFFWSIPLVVLGQFFVLLTFAEASSQYPIAGGVYQWAKRLVGPRYAWLSGWLYTWALLVTIASIAFSAASYAGPLFGYSVTYASTVITALVVIAIATAINLAGVRRLAFFSAIGTAAEVAATLGLGIYLLLFDHHRGLSVILKSYGAAGGHSIVGPFLAAALFSVWIFYGFEACGDIAEEVKNPSRTIPKAMRRVLGIGAIASTVITLGFLVAIPNIGAVISGKDANPVGTVLTAALGGFGAKIALAVIVFAFVSCTTSLQAAATRLVYSYGRDGVLVGGHRLSSVHPRFHMPPGAVMVTSLVPAVIVFLPSATVARIITFAAVGIYVGFQSVVLASIIARARGWKPSGAFRLGNWGWVVNLAALAYGVSAIVVLSVKTPPNGPSFLDRWLVPVSVAIFAVAGLAYMAIFRPKENIRADARAESVVEA